MSSDKVKGTVVRFMRGRGFGFIKPNGGGKNVFVHWEDLETDDHWPYIARGTVVEYQLVKEDGVARAKDVTLEGGDKIPVFTKPYDDRVVNEDQTFVGTLKFFDGQKGFGFLKPDEEISFENVSAGDGLFFSRDALIVSNAGKGMILRLTGPKRLSFKVYKDEKGLGACQIQNEDETPFKCEKRKEKPGSAKGRKRKRKGRKGDGNKKPAKKAKTKEELIEEREIDEDESIYTGTVKMYKPDKEFGFINIAEEITFKDTTVKDKIYVMKEDIVCYSDEVGLIPEAEVIFKVYKDSKGLGASEVMNADGTPITYVPPEAQEDADTAGK